MITGTNYADPFYLNSDAAIIEKNAKEHPESSLAQFLLLYHYKKSNDPRFEKLAKQTALYFTNPNWLLFQLDQTQFKEEIHSLKPESKEETPFEATFVEGNKIAPEILQEEIMKEEVGQINEPEEMKIENPGENDDDLVPFEPLHTVDYFASQGIRLKEELLMNDKLGKQMRSFTEWLKSMKKLHPGKLPEQNEVIEKIIQTSAEESNTDTEVLTEAMAEVLIKQDKKEKAVEMYQKLSLMNPAKSAYFAAKIESIKTN